MSPGAIATGRAQTVASAPITPTERIVAITAGLLCGLTMGILGVIEGERMLAELGVMCLIASIFAAACQPEKAPPPPITYQQAALRRRISIHECGHLVVANAVCKLSKPFRVLHG